MIIRALVKQENLNVEIIGCPIIREVDGLAMSSRNVHLKPEERKVAPNIYKALIKVRDQIKSKSIGELVRQAEESLNALPGMAVEYLIVADENSLRAVQNWEDAEDIRVFVATFLGEIRLIDNLKV